MKHPMDLKTTAQTIQSLDQACTGIIEDGRQLCFIDEALARSWFKPMEDEQLKLWFARFLSIRAALWDTLDEIRTGMSDPHDNLEVDIWRPFIMGYTTGYLIAGLDRFLVEVLGRHKDLIRKLNEGDAYHRIPRKQWTASYKSLTHPANAWRIYEARRLFSKHPQLMAQLLDDPIVSHMTRAITRKTQFRPRGFRRYMRAWLNNRDHTLRRRTSSAREQTEFNFLELGGRTVSEIRDQFAPKQVTPTILTQLRDLLQPGDVLITRHLNALTNLFLPGYWPHAALYMGDAEQRRELGFEDPVQTAAIPADCATLEALKDGVRFRPLATTLAVDAVAVIRPNLTPSQIAQGITRACQHEGKAYNFDFSFFSADKLVCTEVVYRAFDGLGQVQINLQKRAGRLTLSAEDLLDAALEGSAFKPLALFDMAYDNQIITGVNLPQKLAQTYRA